MIWAILATSLYLVPNTTLHLDISRCTKSVRVVGEIAGSMARTPIQNFSILAGPSGASTVHHTSFGINESGSPVLFVATSHGPAIYDPNQPKLVTWGTEFKNFVYVSTAAKAPAAIFMDDTGQLYYTSKRGNKAWSEARPLGVKAHRLAKNPVIISPLGDFAVVRIQSDDGVAITEFAVVNLQPNTDLPPKVLKFEQSFYEGRNSAFVEDHAFITFARIGSPRRPTGSQLWRINPSSGEIWHDKSIPVSSKLHDGQVIGSVELIVTDVGLEEEGRRLPGWDVFNLFNYKLVDSIETQHWSQMEVNPKSGAYLLSNTSDRTAMVVLPPPQNWWDQLRSYFKRRSAFFLEHPQALGVNESMVHTLWHPSGNAVIGVLTNGIRTWNLKTLEANWHSIDLPPGFVISRAFKPVVSPDGIYLVVGIHNPEVKDSARALLLQLPYKSVM